MIGRALVDTARWCLDRLMGLPEGEKARYFALGLVPTSVLALALAIYFGPLGLHPEEQLSVVRLRTDISRSTIVDRDGFLIVVHPTRETRELDIGISWDGKSPSLLQSSISETKLAPILSDVRWSDIGLALPLDLAGGLETFVIGGDSKLGPYVRIGGRRVRTDHLLLRRTRVEGLALAVVIVTAFSIGFSVRRGQ